jgi:hypothetical protein
VARAVGSVATGRGSSRLLALGPLRAGFTPEAGGRLDWLTHADVDLVLPPGWVPGFHGDTFWPSPQALWEWPPPAVLDAGRYEVLDHSSRAITMRSAVDPSSGVAFTKHYALVTGGVDISVTITSAWPRPHALAPWQVTRAPRTGLLVWAAGEAFTDADRLVKQHEDPGCWFVHAGQPDPFPGLQVESGLASIVAVDVPRTCKLFTDARGWLAHVHDGTVFLRIFPDIAPEQAAPRQAELELYFNPDRDYLELENQGPHVTLHPGSRVRYDVEWRMAALGPDVPTDRVTPALVEAIAGLLGRR